MNDWRNKPETEAEFLAYILEYQDDIYVRAELEGKWQPVALSKLEPIERANRILRFLLEGIVPVRILREEPKGD